MQEVLGQSFQDPRNHPRSQQRWKQLGNVSEPLSLRLALSILSNTARIGDTFFPDGPDCHGDNKNTSHISRPCPCHISRRGTSSCSACHSGQVWTYHNTNRGPGEQSFSPPSQVVLGNLPHDVMLEIAGTIGSPYRELLNFSKCTGHPPASPYAKETNHLFPPRHP